MKTPLVVPPCDVYVDPENLVMETHCHGQARRADIVIAAGLTVIVVSVTLTAVVHTLHRLLVLRSDLINVQETRHGLG